MSSRVMPQPAARPTVSSSASGKTRPRWSAGSTTTSWLAFALRARRPFGSPRRPVARAARRPARPGRDRRARRRPRRLLRAVDLGPHRPQHPEEEQVEQRQQAQLQDGEQLLHLGPSLPAHPSLPGTPPGRTPGAPYRVRRVSSTVTSWCDGGAAAEDALQRAGRRCSRGRGRRARGARRPGAGWWGRRPSTRRARPRSTRGSRPRRSAPMSPAPGCR